MASLASARVAAVDAALKAAGVAGFSGWPHSRRMVASRQWVLKEAGFDPGPIDGVEGSMTRRGRLCLLQAGGRGASMDHGGGGVIRSA